MNSAFKRTGGKKVVKKKKQIFLLFHEVEILCLNRNLSRQYVLQSPIIYSPA